MKNPILVVLITCLCTHSAFSQSQLPEIEILSAQFDQSIDFLTIQYSVLDPDDTEFTVDVLISDDGGERFDFVVSSINGDVGAGVVNDGPKELILGVSGLDPMLAVARLIVSDNDTLDIQAVVDQVDMDRIRQNLLQIQGIRHRNGDQAHVDSVRAFIISSLHAMNNSPEVYPFMFGAYEAQNIIGRSRGIARPNTEYYIGGHYDSVINSPGADDNGTAIAAMLEVAHVLNGLTFDKTIRYVAWDLEESGLLGSMDFVNNELEQPGDIEGYLNFEMIGYYKDEPNAQSLPAGFNLLFPAAFAEIQANEFRGDFLTNVGNTANSMALMTTFEEQANTYVPELKVISVASPGSGASVPDLLRSDHASFWFANIPAVMLTDGANFRNPNYHTEQDVVDSLDMEFLANNTKAAVAFLASQSEYNHADFVDIDSIEVLSGIEPIATNQIMRLFPVPADDVLFIQLDDEKFDQIESLFVYNQAGRVIYKIANDEIDKEARSISIKHLSTGVYFLQATLGTTQLSQKFFIER